MPSPLSLTSIRPRPFLSILIFILFALVFNEKLISCFIIFEELNSSFSKKSLFENFAIEDVFNNIIPNQPDKYSSASRAAIQPMPAAVTACLYLSSVTSPAAKTPSMFVLVESAAVDIYPLSFISN